MASKDTTLEDIADSITVLGSMVSEQLNGLQEQISDLQDGQRDLQIGQRETNVRLKCLEGETEALRNDVKELYQLSTR